jgi:hypothetical protein
MVNVASLSDDALVAHVGALVARERHVAADLVESLGELDARQLYLPAGCSSLFIYCTRVLHLSEGAAYDRIQSARCVRRFPQIVERLRDGSLTVAAVCLLRPVITEQNVDRLLAAALHKSKREVERLVVEMRPLPAVPTSVRKLPPPSAPAPSSSGEPIFLSSPQPPRPLVRPLAPEIYKVQFTLSSGGYERLRRAQDLLRHTIPNGDAGAILERALALLVEDLEKKKLAATARPRNSGTPKSHGRYISAAVKREVWRRDKGRCTFVGTLGRCGERAFLEVHHVVPFADGGQASARNLQLRCHAHNQFEAGLWSGAHAP